MNVKEEEHHTIVGPPAKRRASWGLLSGKPPTPANGSNNNSNTNGNLHRGASNANRPVCDNCRTRRIRCDYTYPCRQCINAALTCKRDQVPRKRGPKPGHGRVLDKIRSQYGSEDGHHPQNGVIGAGGRQQRDGSTETQMRTTPTTTGSDSNATSSRTSTAPGSPEIMATVPPLAQQANEYAHNLPTPRPEQVQYRPTTKSYMHLIPLCVDLYFLHIYPIMPLIHLPTIRALLARSESWTPADQTFMYALSALTSLHMSSKHIPIPESSQPDSWEKAGRFFLEEALASRKTYDFVSELKLSEVISSFWLSTSHFEIGQSVKSWFYLREAVTLAIEMGLDDEARYRSDGHDEEGKSEAERIEGVQRRRVFWQLFVTERSYAILRNKPIAFTRRTPRLPTTRWAEYESADVHSGFLQLISSYVPLDESFVSAWNDSSSNPDTNAVSGQTYLSLQKRLETPPSFLRSSFSQQQDEEGQERKHTPTEIQKADLLITQQWLRLITWQSSFRRGLLSSTSNEESMSFTFPLSIAHRTASILQSLPASAVEVHGMGIFEKIFEIGNWWLNVLEVMPPGQKAKRASTGLGGAIKTDPLELFVKTLSGSENSRKKFAERLVMFAGVGGGLGQKPDGLLLSANPQGGFEQDRTRMALGHERSQNSERENLTDEERAVKLESVSPPQGKKSDTTTAATTTHLVKRPDAQSYSGIFVVWVQLSRGII
ncbi:hypothetical protein QBC35DRAFT_517138 [Podospora australis]|uniref:Zn(2)-C6 fungal-type domain-containing protein n=1 Tax=Podospora australis TaxID=1536484 RepID=A0AAN7AFV7_9PEZI|nr:hypothetical protein QBC35DRAFT_517138 [Podospora australis]